MNKMYIILLKPYMNVVSLIIYHEAIGIGCAFKNNSLFPSNQIKGQKSWKLNFEIIDDPSGSTFCLVFEVPDPYGYLWDHALF